MNKIYYGDNLDVLRRYIKDETIDLCYIDPPFNSKRNYNQIYNNVGKEDKAQAQAFTDTWEWDKYAELGLTEIKTNYHGVFTEQSIDLISGLEKVLKKGSLLAYLVSMTLRIAEIHRVLKPTGGFYLHCDPTASHYLKLVLDAIFCVKGGNCINEIIWCYSTGGRAKEFYPKKHDVIFWYAKSKKYIFKYDDVALERDTSTMHEPILYDEKGRAYQRNVKNGKEYKYFLDKGVLPNDWWTDIQAINPSAKERMGYPTQKPEALLERIIKASSNEGDVILDAYCGCGTTVAVAEKLNRQWIGIDITYQSISLILKRLSEHKKESLDNIEINGIPKDFESAVALATKIDDRTRKEFEKWIILTYSKNRAIINDKKGGDKGIDGVMYINDHYKAGNIETKKVIFQVKSDKKLSPDVVRELMGTITINNAVCGILLTLYRFDNLIKVSKECGYYHNQLIGSDYPKIQVVCVEDILQGVTNTLPIKSLNEPILKMAEQHSEQEDLF